MVTVQAHDAQVILGWDVASREGDYAAIFGRRSPTFLSAAREPVTFSVSFAPSASPPYHITQSRLFKLITGRRLPGSLATKRLRKKRSKALGEV